MNPFLVTIEYGQQSKRELEAANFSHAQRICRAFGKQVNPRIWRYTEDGLYVELDYKGGPTGGVATFDRIGDK